MKRYNYEGCNQVIGEAWKLAIKHLEDTLGDQYECNCTENAMEKFWDYAQQDMTFYEECPRCGKYEDEVYMSYASFRDNKMEMVCYDCYTELVDAENE